MAFPKRYKGIKFEIGEAFPPDKPLARWAAVVAMMWNDAVYLLWRLDCLLSKDGPAEWNLFYWRLVASHYWEVAKFLSDTQRWWPEVAEFLTTIPDAAQDDLALVLAPYKPSHPMHDRFRRVRGFTFHYPEVQEAKAERGLEELMNGIRRIAKPDEGTAKADIPEGRIVGGDALKDSRALFADEILVNMMAMTDKERDETFEALRDIMGALLRFCDRSLYAYLGTLPDEAYTFYSDATGSGPH